MQECSTYSRESSFFSFFLIPAAAEHSVFFFLFSDRSLFELAAPNSAGKTILTGFGMRDTRVRIANVVSQEGHWIAPDFTSGNMRSTRNFTSKKTSRSVGAYTWRLEKKVHGSVNYLVARISDRCKNRNFKIFLKTQTKTFFFSI